MANFDNKFTGNKFKTRFATKRDDWETPASLFDPLNAEFHFTLDVCATAESAKCKRYYTLADDGLKQPWEGVCWMNPPFGKQGLWVKKAYAESQRNGTTVVCLLPSRTNTGWWHDIAMKGEVRFIRGRPIFKGAEHGLPQPLAIVVFRAAHVLPSNAALCDPAHRDAGKPETL